MSESLFRLAEVPRRCAEMTRTPRGYERCHRDQHTADQPHHVRDRCWTSGGKMPQLQLGQPCTDACCWPERLVPYFGHKPGASTVTSWADDRPRSRRSRAKSA